jgi:hypothetical protein
VATFFQQFGLPDWAVLALISATPAIELRGGVPVGNWMGISPALTFVICLLGNMAPIAPMLLALRSSFFKKLAAPLLARAEKKLAGLPTGQSRTLGPPLLHTHSRPPRRAHRPWRLRAAVRTRPFAHGRSHTAVRTAARRSTRARIGGKSAR